MNAKKIALKIIERCGTRNPFYIAEMLKIQVIQADLAPELSGYFHQNDNKNPFIVLNQNLTEIEQKTVCAHEIGHAIMHKELNTAFLSTQMIDSTGKYERQAWTFAAELLIPDEAPLEWAGLSYGQYAARLGCPVELLKYKKFPTTDGPEFY